MLTKSDESGNLIEHADWTASEGESPKNLENSIVQRFRKNQRETISTSSKMKMVVSDQFKNL